jgi:predicted short-subunit dehydrogenase-like oxidoreductase (DUF2520 family)
VVLHCAGARGPDELAACAARGAHVAGAHPVVSFAGPSAGFGGATFVVHGDPAAVRRVRVLARHLGARVVALPVLGPAYHAACALVANGSAALAHAGVGGLVGLGLSQKQAELALSGLLRTVADNVASVGVPRALTGPVVRGDAQTVARHLSALESRSPALARTYAQLLPVVVACALDAGLTRRQARAIERALESANT